MVYYNTTNTDEPTARNVEADAKSDDSAGAKGVGKSQDIYVGIMAMDAFDQLILSQASAAAVFSLTV